MFKNLFDGGTGTISQSVPTVPGNQYEVSGWLADNNVESGTVTVSFGSTTGVSVSGGKTSTTYAQFSFIAVATDVATDFVFGGTVTSGTFFIDDISIIDLGPL